jgi:hypothetical protein
VELSAHGLIAAGSATVGYDVTGASLPHAPAGAQLAGYSTGSGGIPWTTAQFGAHPGAVRIDQDAGASDPTADVLDVERGAATFADCPGWVKRAQNDFRTAARPGQRWPAIYASASSITPVVNSLIAGGIDSGVGLWVANWSLSQAQAFADVVNAAGPFPIVAVQWSSGQFYDTDVFSQHWLKNVSTASPGLTWSWWVTDGIVSLAGVARQLTAAGSPGMTPAHILRATCTKNGGHWDTQTYNWLNLVLGDPGAAPHTPIPAGARLWVLQ